MSRIRLWAVCATGSNRRIDLAEPPNAVRPYGSWERSGAERQSQHWQRAWDATWRRPARTMPDLIARARLAISDPAVMGETEGVRLARDVLAVLAREGRI